MNESVLLDQAMTSGWDAQMLAILWPMMFAYSIISLVCYLLQAWGMYMINKKLWEDYPWMAFIPFLNIYAFVKAAGKPWIWVLWLIIGFALFFIPWLIMSIMLLNKISERTGNWIWTTILLILFPYIMFPVVWYNMKEIPKWTSPINTL